MRAAAIPTLMALALALTPLLPGHVLADPGPTLYLPLLSLSTNHPDPTPTPTPTVTPTPSPTLTPTPTATPTSTPAPAATPTNAANIHCTNAGADQLCAWVSNPDPQRYTNVAVYSRLYRSAAPVANRLITTTWHYKTTTPVETCTTGANGLASCVRNIGGASPGYTVVVDVSAGSISTYTTFTPR
jgi:hypothetical protein